MAKRVGKTDDQPFVKLFRELTYHWTPWEVWQDFVTMYACAISNAVDKSHFEKREELYLKRIQKYNKKEQEIFPQLAAEVVLAPRRRIRSRTSSEVSSWRLTSAMTPAGQFFTPYDDLPNDGRKCLCDNVLPTIEAKGYISINDCACGAGATLIAGVHAAAKQISKAGLNWQNHILVTAQDVDYTVAYMCYIQLSLLGVAGYIKVGNSLTEPMCSDDSLENYWFTPIYCSDVWTIRRLFKGGTLL